MMKSILIMMLVLAAPAWGGTEVRNLRTTGQRYGMCDGQNYHWCSQQLKWDAERDAEWNLRSDCNLYQGRLGFQRCWMANCYPGFMTPDQPSQMVQCRVDCEASCEITRP